jgi:hypothetical protein
LSSETIEERHSRKSLSGSWECWMKLRALFATWRQPAF